MFPLLLSIQTKLKARCACVGLPSLNIFLILIIAYRNSLSSAKTDMLILTVTVQMTKPSLILGPHHASTSETKEKN